MNERQFVNRKADGLLPSHNEYFSNDEEEQNKAARWVGYIFPIPLND